MNAIFKNGGTRDVAMRINIEIDEVLMANAQRACGLATKKQIVEEASRLMIRLRSKAPSVCCAENIAGAAISPQAAAAAFSCRAANKTRASMLRDGRARRRATSSA